MNTGIDRKREGCLANAVAVFGDKWTVLLIDALSDGPLRFGQLQEAAGGVNPRTLSQRLTSLEANGIVTKRVFNKIPPHTEYRLTPKGLDVLPIIASLKAWSDKYPAGE